jgi:DNA-binding CsgD family transcriptional regulator
VGVADEAERVNGLNHLERPHERHRRAGERSSPAIGAVGGPRGGATLQQQLAMSPRLGQRAAGPGRPAYVHVYEPTRSGLTPRELQVLRRAADGANGPAIAADLWISPATVKSHFENIYEKLGVSNRAGAVAAALRCGVIT